MSDLLLGANLTAKSKIVTPIFRGSYMHVWKPQNQDDGRKRYSLTAIFDPKNMNPLDKELWAQMYRLYEMVKDNKWPDKKGRHGPQAGLKLLFRGQETHDLVKNPAYEGKITVSMASYDRPIAIVDRNRIPVADQSLVYSGAFFKSAITMYPYDNAGGGVACSFGSLIKVMDGEPLVAQNNPEKDYAALDLSDYEESADPSALASAAPGLSASGVDLKALGLG